MSFPRAKIQRFNENKTCTPSPAEYNVELRKHITQATISKSERFIDPSPANSDNGSTISQNSSAVFRTPIALPRKPKHPTSESKSKPAKLFNNNENISEQLKEKLVECSNKDHTIRELTDQLEEYKQSLKNIEAELSHFKIKAEQLQVDLQNVDYEKEAYISNIRQEANKNIHEKASEIRNAMNNLKTDYEDLKIKNGQDLSNFLKELEVIYRVNNELNELYEKKFHLLNEELQLNEFQLSQLQEDYTHLKDTYMSEFINIESVQELELKRIENNIENKFGEVTESLKQKINEYDEILKDIENSKENEIEEIKRMFELEKIQILNDNDAKVKQLTEDFEEMTLLAEMQMKESLVNIEENWKFKLEHSKSTSDVVLKEYQNYAEHKITQIETEKSVITDKLNEIKLENEKLIQVNQDVKNERDYFKLERDVGLENIKSLENEMTQMESNNTEIHRMMNQVLNDNRIFELTIQKTRATVEALTKRLMESDKDVEQMKIELEVAENSKLELEARCNQLVSELDILCGLCDDREEQHCLALRVCEEKAAQLEQELMNKVEHYKQKSLKEITSKTEEVDEIKTNLKEVMEQLHSQQTLIVSAQNITVASEKEIKRLENCNNETRTELYNVTQALNNAEESLRLIVLKDTTLKQENSNLKEERDDLKSVVECLKLKKQELEIRVNELTYDFQQVNGSNSSQINVDNIQIEEKYNALMEQFQAMKVHNAELEAKVIEQENLIGPFRGHLEAYENERYQLMSEKKFAEQEAKEMGLKFAQLLGHQNQKQKIKHLRDLKNKNYELIETKKELETKVQKQMKTIEVLKKEISSLPKTSKRSQIDDKENISSPNRTLKERN